MQKAQLNVLVKMTEMPQAEVSPEGTRKFTVQCDEYMATVVLTKKQWASVERQAAQHPRWMVVFKAKPAVVTDKSVLLDCPGIEVFALKEPKDKQPAAPAKVEATP